MRSCDVVNHGWFWPTTSIVSLTQLCVDINVIRANNDRQNLECSHGGIDCEILVSSVVMYKLAVEMVSFLKDDTQLHGMCIGQRHWCWTCHWLQTPWFQTVDILYQWANVGLWWHIDKPFLCGSGFCQWIYKQCSLCWPLKPKIWLSYQTSSEVAQELAMMDNIWSVLIICRWWWSKSS